MPSPPAPFDYYVARIGPWPYDNGPTVFYAAFTPDGDYVHGGVRQPPDDRTALREIAAALPPGHKACSSELAEHAVEAGFEVQPMPPEVAQARATTALLASWRTKDRIGLDVADRLARACAPFFDASPWKVVPECKRRRTTLEIVGGDCSTWTMGSIQVLADSGARGPGIILRDFHDLGMNVRRLAGVLGHGRLRVTLSTDPACAAAAMEDAHGVPRFPRISDVFDEILFPLSPPRLLVAALALRAAAAMAKAPSEPAVATLTHEGLVTRFTIHPTDEDPMNEDPPKGTLEWLRSLARAAAHELYRMQDGVMLGCDVVMCSSLRDPVARKIAAADGRARRKNGEPRAKVLRYPKSAPMVRARWIRLPPILDVIQREVGKQMLDYFFVEQPVDSIRIFLVGGARTRIYNVDRDSTVVRWSGGQVKTP